MKGGVHYGSEKRECDGSCGTGDKRTGRGRIVDLGLPVSVVINSLYRQIIMNNGLPFPLTIPRTIPSRDAMTKEEFDAMMLQGLEQAKTGQGLGLDEAFAKIRDSI